MSKLAILIPSRNETYLTNTLIECFSKAAGEVEVVVTLEGYWPADWKDLTAKYPNLHTVHHGEPRGLRAAINSAAASAMSRGAEYLLKLDAHCMLDEGYDTKLLADMEPNWIVVPRRKRLDAVNWALQDVGKPDIDYHYLSFPDDPNDFGGPGLNGKVWDQRIKERLGKPEYNIDDEMSSQGSAWCMAASYFTELQLMDQASYGPFWNEAQELFLKCWLSGGRGIVNKKTWYAHLHKSKTYESVDGKKGRGYHLPEAWLTQGASYTKRWIYNDAWVKQTLPFEWLIDHFWPVPGWREDWREVLYATKRPRALVGVAAGVGDSGDCLLAADVDSGSGRKGALGVNGEKQHGQGVKADDYAESLKSVDNEPLNIVSARYGVLGSQPPFKDHSIDVKERLQSLVSNNSLDIIVNNSTLCPGQNPFRGKRKVLLLTYAWGDREGATVEREEKDWLIIGQVQRVPRTPESEAAWAKVETVIAEVESLQNQRLDVRDGENPIQQMPKEFAKAAGSVVTLMESNSGERKQVMQIRRDDKPLTATALNDYLIRKFSISPQRLRAPMPIELRDFHRNDLAQLFAELGFKRGAEIGVAEGNYSEVLLKANPTCELLLVDPWHAYGENPQNKSKEKHEFAYNETLRKTAPFPNVKIDMRYSMDAVRDVANGTLDWVYLDAMHSFNFVMMDLICWSDKVRSGGVIALDDFYFIDRARWGAGVVEAVQAFTSAHQVHPWFVCQGHKSVEAFWVNA